MPIVAPIYPSETRLTIHACRVQTKLIIETALGVNADVRLHNDWKLKTDLGKTVTMLKTATGAIHAWMIGTQSNRTDVDGNGDFPFVGGTAADRRVVLSIWGFFDAKLKDPDSGKSTQQIAEDEHELIADWIKAQKNSLGFDSKPAQLKRVGPLQLDNLDSHDFSEGDGVFVAQCSLEITLRR